MGKNKIDKSQEELENSQSSSNPPKNKIIQKQSKKIIEQKKPQELYCKKIIYGQSSYYFLNSRSTQKTFNSDYQQNTQKILQNFQINFDKAHQKQSPQTYIPAISFKKYLLMQKVAEQFFDCQQVVKQYEKLSKQYLQKYQKQFQDISKADQQLNLEGWTIDFLYNWKLLHFSEINIEKEVRQIYDIEHYQKTLFQLIQKSKFNQSLKKIYEHLNNLQNIKQIKAYLYNQKSQLFSEQFLIQTNFQHRLIQNFFKYKNKNNGKSNQHKIMCLIIIFLEHRLFRINQKIARSTLVESIFQMANNNSSFFKACFDNMHKSNSIYFANLKMIKRIITAISYHRNYFFCLRDSLDWTKNNGTIIQISQILSSSSIFNPDDFFRGKQMKARLNLRFYDKNSTTDLNVQGRSKLSNDQSFSFQSEWNNLFIDNNNTNAYFYLNILNQDKQPKPEQYPLFKFMFLIEQIRNPVAFIMFRMSKQVYQNPQNAHDMEFTKNWNFPVGKQNFQQFHLNVNVYINRFLDKQNRLKIPYLGLKLNLYRFQHPIIQQNINQILTNIGQLFNKLCSKYGYQVSNQSFNNKKAIKVMKKIADKIANISSAQ